MARCLYRRYEVYDGRREMNCPKCGRKELPSEMFMRELEGMFIETDSVEGAINTYKNVIAAVGRVLDKMVGEGK